MSQSVQQIWTTLQQVPAFEPGLLLLLTILLARYASLPQQYRPWPLLHILAQRIASKVNKATDSRFQQRLAGTLALLVVLTPILTLAWTLRQLSEWPVGYDAFILYLCLDHRHFSRQIEVVSASLRREQFQLAKDQLQPLLRRDCSQLSPAGLSKAGIEVLAQRQLRHLIAVVFWFVLAGPMVALGYRIVLELQQAWSGKISSQRAFSTAVSGLSRLFSWPVFWLHGSFVAVLYRFGHCLRFYGRSQQAGLPRAERWFLSAWSAALQRNLAGPVMYQGHKTRRQRIGPDLAPALADLELAQRLDVQIQRAFLLLVCCVVALMVLYQWPQS